MAADTIREFLVAVGFKTDEAALKNLETGLAKSTKAVIALAAAVEGTAVLVAAGIARFASNLEALYFAAQRTGSSVANLRAMDRAAQDFGATAGEMTESIEGLAHALRINPGNEGLLQGLGVHLQRTKTGAVDAQNAMLQLATVFQRVVAQSGGQLYVAEQYAQMLGINEHTLLALLSPDFINQVKKTQDLMRGFNWEQAAKNAHEFENNVRDLWTLIESIGVDVSNNLAQKFGFADFKDFNEWLSVHGHEVSERITNAIETILYYAGLLKDGAIALVGKLVALDKSTDGWSTKLLILAGILKITGAGSIIGGVLSLAGAFGKLTFGIAGATAAAAGTGGLLGALGKFGAVGLVGAGGYAIGTLLNKLGPDGDLGGWLGDKLYDWTHRGEEAMQFFKSRGYSGAQAAGIVANLMRESHMMNISGDNGAAQGIAQWRGDRQLDFKKLTGHDVKDANFHEQLEFVAWELRNHPEYGDALLRATQSADQAGRIVDKYYERPRDPNEANVRAGMAANINQETVIHAYGGDSAEVAKLVTQKQKDVNADLTRGFGIYAQ